MTQGNTNNYSNSGYVPQGNPQANPYMPQGNPQNPYMPQNSMQNPYMPQSNSNSQMNGYTPQNPYMPQNGAQNPYMPQGNYNPQMNYFDQAAAAPAEKKGRSKVFIAAMIVSAVALVAVLTVFAIHFVNKNVKSKKKEHVYTVEEVKSMYGYDDVYEKEYTRNGITYTMCYPRHISGSSATEYHLIYIFASADDASSYFEALRTDYFRDITAEGEKYMEGWISGICDADEKDRAELKDNMIVFEELEFVGYDF